MNNAESFLSQCTECGQIYKVNIKYKPRSDDIYNTLYCCKCEEMTRQLDCGEDEDRIYEFMDINVDPRYY